MKDKEGIIQAIYTIVKLIPYGRATSYGAIAKAIGYPNMSRMVGRIMGESSSADIPAYRVVNSQGILSAKAAFGNNDEMQKRLEEEGIVIRNDRICNWRTVFWNPIEEIRIEDL
ncbi:MAG: MGMT family protein [Prevotella sp.]|jgi:methylated-DNA-protein-cysteine methyltransferase-like protein|nr:MGMT family protein [Prevotella sp.]